MQMKADPFLTSEKFAELNAKLEKLLKVSQPRATAEVSRLALMGDFSENVAYGIAKGRLRGINQRILELENTLKNAKIIKNNTNNNFVQIGHTVTVQSNNQEKTYQILGSTETNPTAGTISHLSPLGVALMGKKVGDVTKLKLADKEVEYKVVKIG